MIPFRVLEHTADVGFEAFGRTREEVFANAGRALVDLMVSLETIKGREETAIEVEGRGAPALLVNWLSEILYLFDTEGRLFADFTVRRLDERRLAVAAHGEKFERGRHQVKLLVKAITYYQLSLEPAPEGWRAQVYVDI